MSKISEKVKVINTQTYKEIQENNLSKPVASRPIRNAKYKRLSSTFNLMQYLLLKYKKSRNQQHRKRKAKLLPLNRQRKGKQRECKRIKLSKLKKTIILCRQLKQQQRQQHDLPLMQPGKEVIYVEQPVDLDPLPKNDDTITSHIVGEDDKTKIQLQIQSLKIETNDEILESTHSLQNFNVKPLANTQLKRNECNDEKSVSKNWGSMPEKSMQQRQIVHSGRFREYCDNCSTPRLKELSEHLLRESNRFQKRSYELNQIKGAAHRRFVIGFHEIQSLLKVKKIQLIIIATDCEKCEGKGGLDEIITNIKATCKDQQVPLAFVFKRRQLAYVLWKKASISCVGLLNCDGLHETFNKFLAALKDARQMYLKLTEPTEPV